MYKDCTGKPLILLMPLVSNQQVCHDAYQKGTDGQICISHFRFYLFFKEESSEAVLLFF